MEEESENGIVLDTKGNCFLCRDSISRLVPEADSASALSSINYLSQYLRMDMGTLKEKLSVISPNLVEVVNGSNLKVKFCGECRQVSDKFDGLYKQFVEIRLEIMSCLSKMKGKLEKGEGAGKKRKGGNSSLSDLVNDCITDAMRQEVMAKCTERLTGCPPRVEIRRLAQKRKCQSPRQGRRQPTKPRIEEEITDEEDQEGVSKVKLENADVSTTTSEEGDDFEGHIEATFEEDLLDCNNPLDDSVEDDDISGPDNEQIMNEDVSNQSLLESLNQLAENTTLALLSPASATATPTFTFSAPTVPQPQYFQQRNPTPISTRGRGRGKYQIVTERPKLIDKFTCGVCFMSFKSTGSKSNHMARHFPGKFPCKHDGCLKVFVRKDEIVRHTRNVHKAEWKPS